jgi:histidinol dehydrogenase
VNIYEGAEAGRRTLLRRRPLGTADLPETVRRRTREVFGADLSVEETVRRIIADVRDRGDEALRYYTRAFDGADIERLEVTPDEIRAAYREIDPDLTGALRIAAERLRVFHEAQREHAARPFSVDGAANIVRAVDRAGVYVPSHRGAVYPSSVIHTVMPARAAGVREVILCTPCDPDGRVAPVKLVAADLAGADRVFRVSGAQAIAAMAYGTESIPRVDIVCGPGNIFVTVAKKEVFGEVGIDALYGPSETIVIADESADPRLCAADLIAQAEHDELASPILITTSRALAERVAAEVEAQLSDLPRGGIARASFAARGGAVVVETLDEAIVLANEYAPEHLCLLTRDAHARASQVRNAGAVFVGETSPESLGDYTAGPSHTMPTAGTARFASPLSVHHFLRVMSVVEVDRAAIERLGPSAALIARFEGFAGHARSIEYRVQP